MVEIRVYVGKEINAIADRVFRNSNTKISVMYYGACMHHTDIERGLTDLFKDAIEIDRDVHLHTNSIDVIEWLPSVLSELGLSDNFTMIRIGRSAKTSNKGKMIDTCFDMRALEAMNAVGHEMR